ncbi:MAG: DUF2155 domain-containing protein [Cypionkella sp.]
MTGSAHRAAGSRAGIAALQLRRAVTVLVAAGFASAALPQDARAEVVVATGGMVRVLDRMTNTVTDFDLAPGQEQVEGKLSVRLDECRYPSDLPLGEAYAHLTIKDQAQVAPIFSGWMIASSPALNALDHPRYDVWVLRCDVPASDLPAPDQTDSTSSDTGSGG